MPVERLADRPRAYASADNELRDGGRAGGQDERHDVQEEGDMIAVHVDCAELGQRWTRMAGRELRGARLRGVRADNDLVSRRPDPSQ